MFEFQLAPIEEIHPWGEPPEQKLHWFGLTDGTYHMDIGGNQLFRYTDEILAHWAKKYSKREIFTPFVDYQVVRIWEDLLDVLPVALTPIPSELFKLVSNLDTQRDFSQKLRTVLSSDPSDKEIDLFYLASSWIDERLLSSMHLNTGPSIWFFRHADDIIVRWDNRGLRIDDIRVWESTHGEKKYPITDFLAEVKAFNDNLIDAMSTRIEDLRHRNPIPHVKINLDDLVRDQIERTSWLENALNRRETPLDADQILRAIEEFSSKRP